MLYESGAAKVHVRIACPQIRFPDFYGVDMPTKEELLAHGRDISEMCDYIKASSLKFFSLEGLYKALVGEKRNSNTLSLVIIISLEITQLNRLII